MLKHALRLGRHQSCNGSVAPDQRTASPIAYQKGDPEELPDWQVAQATAKALAREVLVARQNRVADPTVGINGGRIDYGSFRDNVIGVRLSVPLFVRNSFGAEVVAAQADADAADAEVERVVLQLDTERRRAITTYDSSRTAWSRWQASRGTDVELRAGLLERLWKQGELSTADYLLQLRQTLWTPRLPAPNLKRASGAASLNILPRPDSSNAGLVWRAPHENRSHDRSIPIFPVGFHSARRGAIGLFTINRAGQCWC
ncbi:MAG: TolC family protein [Xanthomonadales bacterium]|nr:TolC family protein [Xanthomonadales bacterium]